MFLNYLPAQLAEFILETVNNVLNHWEGGIDGLINSRNTIIHFIQLSKYEINHYLLLNCFFQLVTV